MIIAYRAQGRAVFLYGFAKSERENVRPEQLASLRDVGAYFLAADEGTITKAVEDGLLKEIHLGHQEPTEQTNRSDSGHSR